MMGYGEYVLGIEPCNVLCKSRKALREDNALPILKPGESTTNILEVTVKDIFDYRADHEKTCTIWRR